MGFLLCRLQLLPHKASVKLIEFVRENQIIPWQGVYFFTNTVKPVFVRSSISVHAYVSISEDYT